MDRWMGQQKNRCSLYVPHDSQGMHRAQDSVLFCLISIDLNASLSGIRGRQCAT